MGSKRIYYSMEELRIEGQRLIEPGEIHRIPTNHFQQWLETPRAELEEDWPASLMNEEKFVEMCTHHSLPNKVTTQLWQSVSKRPSESSISEPHPK